jgi:hypothetical protein
MRLLRWETAVEGEIGIVWVGGTRPNAFSSLLSAYVRSHKTYTLETILNEKWFIVRWINSNPGSRGVLTWVGITNDIILISILTEVSFSGEPSWWLRR